MAVSSGWRTPMALPLLCYVLLIVAWIVDLFTPQLFVAAILLNGPIALSSLALQSRLTMRLVVAAEIANVIAGYVNGIQAGHQWSGIALGDRLLAAASFVLVGYLAIKSAEYAREAGASAGRMRQVEIERALREATERVRETLNVELVQRAILRESVPLIGATRAMLVVRDSQVELPLVLSLARDAADVGVERRALSTEMASLTARVREQYDSSVLALSSDDALGRLTLDALGARAALAVRIVTADASTDCVLIEIAGDGDALVPDAPAALGAFAEQAGIALDQARLFAQLGERNEEIERQRNELAHRGEVIRDIVYALAHDLRTPLAAVDVTIKQALAGAYGELPERYRAILRSSLASNDDERRIVETLLLVARYEAGEESTVREPIDCVELIERSVDEMQPLAGEERVALHAEIAERPLTVVGDPGEIRRALVNLIANALAATPEGGSVIVSGRRANGNVELAVEDDGFGVAPERRGSLFERFGGARGGAGTGTGLGLYIVARIAHKHGGSAIYAPREPRGSTFTIVLPQAAA